MKISLAIEEIDDGDMVDIHEIKLPEKINLQEFANKVHQIFWNLATCYRSKFMIKVKIEDKTIFTQMKVNGSDEFEKDRLLRAIKERS